MRQSHVLIVGAGAFGTSAAEGLVRAGIGTLSIIDRDYVEWSNLQRQQLYTEKDAEERLPKAPAAKERLSQINRDVEL
ncbi:ThiF family adenylyltransferase, partial [Bacillus thuringiensis]|uniref:ThiF family adenylyltransferase n=1 Tax=Bacillus thuringiensis TaxID=1428 RepID=UPI00201BDD9B